MRSDLGRDHEASPISHHNDMTPTHDTRIPLDGSHSHGCRLLLDRVRIDAPVEPLVERPQKSGLDTASGRAVALRLLAADGRLTVRGLAAELEMAPSSAAVALKALRAEKLVEEGSTKTVGAPLFW